MRASLVLVTTALLLTACGSRDTEMRRARLAAERRNLAETMDRLEDRLLASQARVRLWKELRGRHESVTAISCASQGEHAVQMATRLERLQQQEQDRRYSSLHRAKVASVSTEPPPSRAPARK